MAPEKTRNKSEYTVKTTNQLMVVKHDLLPVIKAHTYSLPFIKPVDVVELKIPVRF